MAAKRNQITLYFSDAEYEELTFDAARAQQDLNPFAKHVVLSRGKLKVKALPPDAAKEISRLTAQNEELQRQLDALQADKGTATALGSLAGPAKSIDEIVAEKFQKLKDQQDLESYQKLQLEHAKLKGELDERDSELGKLRKLDNFMPVIANGLGAILVNRFPDMAQGIASAANAIGGSLNGLGELPSGGGHSGGGEEMSQEEEKMLDFGRTVFTSLPEKGTAELVMLVNTIAQLPAMLAPVVTYARQILPQVAQPQPPILAGD